MMIRTVLDGEFLSQQQVAVAGGACMESMLPTICLGLLFLSHGAPATDPLFEDRSIATMPEGIGLEGEPVRYPDGSLVPTRARIQWSPDGLQVAYLGRKDGAWHAVVGEHVSKPHDFLGTPIFGNSGEDVVFRAGDTKSKKKEKWILYRGPNQKKKSKSFDWIGAPAISPDGSRVIVWNQPGATLAADGSYQQKGMVLFGGWKKKPKRWDDATALTTPIFSSDGSVVFTAGLRNGTWSVIAVSKKGEEELIKNLFGVRDIAVAPGTDDLAVTASAYTSTRDVRGNRVDPKSKLPDGAFGSRENFRLEVQLHHGGKVIGRDFDAAWDAAFSANGKKVAYKVMKEGMMGVAADDQSGAKPTWDFVTRPALSHDGDKVAFVANTGATLSMALRTSRWADQRERGGEDQLHVFDMKAQADIESVGEPAERIEHVTFGPDENQLAYAARTQDGWRVHCGAFKSETYDEIGPLHFDKKGTVIGFGARSGRELLWRTLALKEE